ncbi:DUF6266 family protein [Pedobacter nyackensis]|uniref:DUF6266 family protein n=1 Tax=Pedobacter nyackensis TaxID=475255 RepID=UPI00292D0495|nr:DUF6266 family protein [Pedobacter nyackensis]
MGILSSGLLGPVRKKVGPSVTRVHNGINVVGATYRKTKKPATDKQLEAQAKFGLLNSFLNHIEELVKPGFKKYAKKKNEINAAYEYNYEHAFIKEDDHFLLNFPEIQYSRGRIATPDEPKISVINNQLNFSWLPQQQYSSCQFTDLASILVYNADREAYHQLINVTDRYAGNHSIEIPEHYAGNTLHCYISFASANGKLTGDSTYIGGIICP